MQCAPELPRQYGAASLTVEFPTASTKSAGPLATHFKQTPILRLPNELLSYVFLFAVHRSYDRSDATTSPIIISHVCPRWRQVALSTGGLWTDIMLTFPPSPLQLSRTATWLSRSQTYPLELLLDFRDPSWDWDEGSHTFRWEDMECILRLLLPHVTRWRRFELLTDTWSPIFTFLWYTRRVKSAPSLRSVALSRCNAYFARKGEVFEPAALREPIPLFGGLELSNLRQVCLAGVHVDWTKSSLQSLTELELKYHASDVMPSLDQFVDILAACPDINRLAIVGWGPQLGSSSDNATQNEGPVDLTKLQRSIRLPQLTRFSFGFLDVNYAIELLSLFCLPALEALSFEDISTSLNPMEPQDASPVLEWMTSTHTSICPSSCHTLACCTAVYFPLAHIKALELRGIRSNQTTLTRFLRELTTLQSLFLFDAESDALQALIPLSSIPSFMERRGASDLICPALAELTCKNVDSGILIDTITSRAQINPSSSLKKVYLDLPDGDDLCITDVEHATFIEAGVRLFISPFKGGLEQSTYFP